MQSSLMMSETFEILFKPVIVLWSPGGLWRAYTFSPKRCAFFLPRLLWEAHKVPDQIYDALFRLS